MAKCWWLKIEPNVWACGKHSCAVCINLQAVEVLEFFGGLAKSLAPFLGRALEKGRVLFFHEHFANSTGICGVTCPHLPSGVNKPLIVRNQLLSALFLITILPREGNPPV